MNNLYDYWNDEQKEYVTGTYEQMQIEAMKRAAKARLHQLQATQQVPVKNNYYFNKLKQSPKYVPPKYIAEIVTEQFRIICFIDEGQASAILGLHNEFIEVFQNIEWKTEQWNRHKMRPVTLTVSFDVLKTFVESIKLPEEIVVKVK